MPLGLTDMRPDEVTGVRQRVPAVLKIRIPDRPGMDHVRPDLQRHIDIGGAGGLGKPRRVREQCLGRPDLNQDRRKARQIGE